MYRKVCNTLCMECSISMVKFLRCPPCALFLDFMGLPLRHRRPRRANINNADIDSHDCMDVNYTRLPTVRDSCDLQKL